MALKPIKLRLDGEESSEDRELAQAILGGYGGFAVIVGAELRTLPASTPAPQVRSLAFSAASFMEGANQLAENSLDGGYMTGVCFTFRRDKRWFNSAIYAWLQADEARAGALSLEIPDADDQTSVPDDELDALWQDLQDQDVSREQFVDQLREAHPDLPDEVFDEAPGVDDSASNWLERLLLKLVNWAIRRIGLRLGGCEKAICGEGDETWPPRATDNVWLNLFFDGPTNAQKFMTALADDGIGSEEQQKLLYNQLEPLTYSPIWVIPMLREKFDDVPMIVLPPAPAEGDPDHGTKWVYFVGIYPGENDRGKAEDLLEYMRGPIYDQARALGATIYQVGSVPISGKEHFQSRWSEVKTLKNRYDPDNILANGFELYRDMTDS